MGTKSVTKVFDGEKVVAAIYQQFDGGLMGVGATVARFAAGADTANGGGCFAAQLVAHLKQSAGGVFMTTADDSQEFNYELYAAAGEPVRMTCRDSDGEVIFEGLASEFHEEAPESRWAHVVDETHDKIVFSCPASAGEITATRSGDGNSYRITIYASGSQYDDARDEREDNALCHVVGAWEAAELCDVWRALKEKNWIFS